MWLNLSSNRLSGPIPSLSSLTKLRKLVISTNQLTGPIPSLSALNDLEELTLNHNQLSGSIPSLSTLTKLELLSLFGNSLTGSIPTLTSLTNLEGVVSPGQPVEWVNSQFERSHKTGTYFPLFQSADRINSCLACQPA